MPEGKAEAKAEAEARAEAEEAEVPSGFEAGAAAIAGMAAAAVALLFRTATLLPGGFFDALAATAIGFGLSPLAHRLLAPSAATLARGFGLAAGALLLTGALVAPFDRAAPPLVAWTLGGALCQAATRAKRNGVVLGALGALLVLIGGALAWYFASTWPEPGRLRATVVGASALAALAFLARVLVVRRAPQVAPSPVGILLVSALASTYVAYRPLVSGRVANLPLYEWSLGVGVAVLLLGRLRRSARDAAVPEAWSGSARKHRQDAAPAYDLRMPPLASAIQRYLESGQGFEEYRAALLRAAPHAPPRFRKALQGMSALQARGRAAKAARSDRLRAHDQLMELSNGDPASTLRAHP